MKLVDNKGFNLKLLIGAILITAMFTGCLRVGCGSDPDEYLLFDTITLMEDYYYQPIEKREMISEAFKGLAIELALRKIQQEQEDKKKEQEKKPDATTPAAEKPSKAEPPKTETPIPEQPGVSTSDDLPVDEQMIVAKTVLEKSPLQIEKTDENITLKFNDKSLSLPYPVTKKELVDEFFKGYRVLAAEFSIPADDKDFFYAGINTMVHSLDPHSSFMSPKIYGQLKDETSGSFAGVGIEVGIRSEYLTVISPLMGTPAHKAGLQSMDRIIAIDGRTTTGMSLFEAVELIRGKIGTSVTLTISRKGQNEPFKTELVRARIEEYSIKGELLPGKIGLVRVYKFNEKTFDHLENALNDLEKESGGLRAMIMDLRNNPGGLLDQAVKVSDKFLDSGMIVNTMGRGMFVDKPRFATGRDTNRDLPIIVLTNIGSASGAEIVAGALKDRHRALLVGTRTFGKGSVQSIFRLPENAGLRLTTALYYTPSGRSIQATGIPPDIEFTFPDEDEAIRQEYSESALQNHITSSKADPEVQARTNFDVERLFEYYKAKGWITIDPEFPEQSDWLLLFARNILKGKDLTVPGMYAKGKALLEEVPPLAAPKKAP